MEIFNSFFKGEALSFLRKIIALSLEEDGEDLTSKNLFGADNHLTAKIVAKQDTIVVGLPIIPLILDHIPGPAKYSFVVREGQFVPKGTIIATMHGLAYKLLKGERVILNFICHLSGIANLTHKFCQKIAGSGVTLLDTRKTLPGLRYPEKYAVLRGGGQNHRLNLSEMLMLKDNHIDQAGSILQAVQKLRQTLTPCPPIEVECRTLAEVKEAVQAEANRIMLDNMSEKEMKEALKLIPEHIESEISGGVTLDNISRIASLKPTYISTGAITLSAPAADFSMQIES
ncbi:carboxylating nicotinate-nucleotide diphosphorylase [Desulfohalobiaceae bacterium Ax17]|uniref:carboxylating nicotinate-nucleotide diphosphorylase n=1 Tax=Desulfovulcanus ferrireducens TaxID=2831190 RepID=UPI00207BBE85|nr:carboxylating nicotinate-nucleotide diphosphorylase [Desulfovulcanus ferrireducens]MBT8763602.1 carboxylating nicotinate-nucleotide diphosphorylase [Desulfovulcanus ferrireducens]